MAELRWLRCTRRRPSPRPTLPPLTAARYSLVANVPGSTLAVNVQHYAPSSGHCILECSRGLRSEGWEETMYAAIRQGKAKAGRAEELARTIKDGAIPIISDVPG